MAHELVVKRCPQRWRRAAAEKKQARLHPAPSGGASGGWKRMHCETCSPPTIASRQKAASRDLARDA